MEQCIEMMHSRDQIKVAIIPARAGSKRLPGKNTKLLAGKPLIDWTVDVALESDAFDLVAITTDDESIIEKYQKNRRVVALKRNHELANDTATSQDVILDTLQKLQITRGLLCLLQPTSPLRTAANIRESYSLTKNGSDKNIDVISYRKITDKWRWAKILDESGYVSEIENENEHTLGKCIIPNGAIYWSNIEDFIVSREFSKNHKCYLMSEECSVDIDSLSDFSFAASLLAHR